jgi:hypothetical protein
LGETRDALIFRLHHETRASAWHATRWGDVHRAISERREVGGTSEHPGKHHAARPGESATTISKQLLRHYFRKSLDTMKKK